jgi:hypothetical protein
VRSQRFSDKEDWETGSSQKIVANKRLPCISGDAETTQGFAYPSSESQ